MLRFSPEGGHMTTTRASLVRQNDASTTWAAIIEESLRPVVAVSLISYWVYQFWFSANARSPYSSDTVITTAYALSLCALCWWLLPIRPRLAVALWVLGLDVGVGIGAALFALPLALYLSALGSLVAALLLDTPHAAGTSAVGLLLLMVLAPALILGGEMSNSAVLSANFWIGVGSISLVTFALGIALHRSMQTMVDWSLNSYEQALDNLKEARERRAEMVNLVKELDTAYYRLARLNVSLLEAWQRASESERRRAELVTTISHEMRTPLNLILGFSEMIMASPQSYGASLPAAYRPDVNAIYRSSMHLLQLIDDVLDLARADVAKLALVREDTDLKDVLMECVAMLEEYVHAKGIALRCATSPDLPKVAADRVRIRQVALNLLTNAARHTEHGYIEIGARTHGDEVLVSVQDTGHGIHPDRLPRIFEPFDAAEATRADGWHAGTGLGLPISRRLVELHGGRMWVESTVGSGTTFYFTLPITENGRGPSRVEYADPAPLSIKRRPALLVSTSDDTLVQSLQKRVDGEVLAAPGLAATREAAVDLRPDLILIDINETLGEEEGPWPAPVLQLPLPDRQRYTDALGVQELLIKPVTKQTLTEALLTLAPGAQRILVVDDDARFSDLVGRMLDGEGEGYHTLAAYAGDEALALLESEPVDAIILDQRLEDTTGASLCPRIRALPAHSRTPIIMVTAYDMEALVDQPATRFVLTLPRGLSANQTFAAVGTFLSAFSSHKASPQPAEAPAAN